MQSKRETIEDIMGYGEYSTIWGRTHKLSAPVTLPHGL